MNIVPAQSVTAQALTEQFTGQVFMEILAPGVAPRPAVLRMTFPPATHTGWHTHPFGQILVILTGRCLVQKKGEAIQEVTAGSSVIIEAGEVHWHGAAPESLMQHLAIQQGETVELERVSDREYWGE